MIYRAVSLILVAVLLHGSVATQAQQQSPSQTVSKMQQVLHKAQEKDKAVKVTLNKKIDNQNQFSGKVSEISDTGFVLTDQKTRTTKRLAYEDILQVKQKGSSKGPNIAIDVGIAAALFVGVAIIVYAAFGGGE
jgi:predicted DNA binding CopG/RHH family protein